jgi:hypothetical protein
MIKAWFAFALFLQVCWLGLIGWLAYRGLDALFVI